MIKHIFESFYSRLALVVFLSFILVGALAVSSIHQSSQAQQHQIAQKLHHDLAKHIVKENQLIKDGAFDSGAMKMVFMNLMVLGPNFEFYLLDEQGQILSYSAEPGKVKLDKVDLSSLKNFLADSAAQQTIYGPDPRSSSRQKIFSAAEIFENDILRGYIYVIIGGELYDNVAERVSQSAMFKYALWTLITGFALALFVTLGAMSLLTKPLRRLTQDVQQFRKEGLNKGSLELDHWNDSSDNEVHQLGSAFHAMAEELQAQYQKVKTTDELRRELISHVSHDLRTPLASMMGYLETWQLKQASLSPEQSAEFIAIDPQERTQDQHVGRTTLRTRPPQWWRCTN